MKSPARLRSAVPLAAAAVLCALVGLPARAQQPRPAVPVFPQVPLPGMAAFDQIKALAGDWVDLDGNLGAKKDAVVVTYRVTGAGSAVIETLFVGTENEMVTVYHKDRKDLVLTHYCAAGNQPRMRCKQITTNVVSFEFDGGTNINPAKDFHMHSATLHLISPDEIKAEWVSWKDGKPADHVGKFHLGRKKS